jgi:hypothetical protein
MPNWRQSRLTTRNSLTPATRSASIILENDPVRDVFAEREFCRHNGVGQRFVTEHIIGMRRFFDPEWIDVTQPLADVERLRQAPLLVRIHHHARPVTGNFTDDIGAAQITFRIARANLQFHRGETGRNGALAIFPDLRVIVIEPTDGCIVTGITSLQDALSGPAGRLMLTQNLQRQRHSEFVFKIREIKRRNNLCGREIKEQLPQRNAAGFSPQIPTCVGNRCERELDHALVRTKPAKLLFVRHRALDRAEIGYDFINGFSGEPLRVKLGRFADELIAFAKREREAGSDPAFAVMQLRDGVGINWGLVNRITPMPVAQGKTCVANRNPFNHDRSQRR